MNVHPNSLKNLVRNSLPEGTHDKVAYYLNNHPEMNNIEICNKVSIGKSTFYKVRKQLEEEWKIASSRRNPYEKLYKDGKKYIKELEDKLRISEDENMRP